MTKAPWQLGLIDSAWFGSEYEGQRGLEEARALGFDSLDLFVGFDPGAMKPAERQLYLDGAKSVDLPIVSLVCTCLGLNDFNPAIRDFHIQRAKNVVSLASEFPTARNICFVPGEYMFQQRLLPPESEWRLVVDATRDVGAHAAGLGLELAIELLPFEFAFVKSLDTMERLLDEVGLPNVKATVDISHMWLMRIPPDDMRRLKGRIAHVHISDCDGVNHGDLPPRPRQHAVRGLPLRHSGYGVCRRRVGRARVSARSRPDARLGFRGACLHLERASGRRIALNAALGPWDREPSPYLFTPGINADRGSIAHVHDAAERNSPIRPQTARCVA